MARMVHLFAAYSGFAIKTLLHAANVHHAEVLTNHPFIAPGTHFDLAPSENPAQKAIAEIAHSLAGKAFVPDEVGSRGQKAIDRHARIGSFNIGIFFRRRTDGGSGKIRKDCLCDKQVALRRDHRLES